ncbi:hypothetical protein WHR41_09461 [Cladosporium halotolerans]|uniref:Zn(2)-C6 fungal-type domain-containing protein n=1 Tax=Cladosporium halotolerans TaxID=1052096 RepID=A0AB34KFA9_9PEZI
MNSLESFDRQNPPADHAPGNPKRAQVNVACNECRRRKAKCDATRPACQQCLSHGHICVFSDTIDAHPTIILKRKYAILEQQSEDEHHVLELLRSSRRADAERILERLRAGDDTHSIVDFALQLASAHSAGRETHSFALHRDQISAHDDTRSVPHGALREDTHNARVPEGNAGPYEDNLRREQASLGRIGEMMLPPFQTFLSLSRGTSSDDRTHDQRDSFREFLDAP